MLKVRFTNTNVNRNGYGTLTLYNFATVVMLLISTFKQLLIKAVRYVHAGYFLGILLVSVCKDIQQVSATITFIFRRTDLLA